MRRDIFRIISWGGIGDALLLTPALRALKAEQPDRKVAVFYPKKSHEEVLRHNPNIDILKTANPLACPFEAFSYYFGLKPFHLVNYGQYSPSRFARVHAAEIIARMLGVKLDGAHMEVFLTSQERDRAAAHFVYRTRTIALHTGANCSSNKNWPEQNWSSLVRRNPQFRFLQLGAADDPNAEGAVDLRGRTTLREAFAILACSDCFVGIESSLAHAASALKIPGIVIFGPTTPQVWGNSNLTNLYKRAPCSPCIDVLFSDPCPYERYCMTDITVVEVENTLYRLFK